MEWLLEEDRKAFMKMLNDCYKYAKGINAKGRPFRTEPTGCPVSASGVWGFPEEHKEFALRRFIECRLMNGDYMASHSLKDIKHDARRRRYVEGFDRIFANVVSKVKGSTKK